MATLYSILKASQYSVSMYLIITYKTKLILSVSIGISLYLISTSSLTQQQMTEEQIDKKFLTYDNPTLGFRMMYPSGWQILEESPGRVIFISPQNTEIRIIVDNISKSIDANKLPLRNITAHNDALNEIKALRGVARNIHDNEVTVGTAHIPGWRIGYNVLGHYIIDTNIVTSGKRFTISYVEVTSKVRDIINNANNA
jgi:hypothetical protein